MGDYHIESVGLAGHAAYMAAVAAQGEWGAGPAMLRPEEAVRVFPQPDTAVRRPCPTVQELEAEIHECAQCRQLVLRRVYHECGADDQHRCHNCHGVRTDDQHRGLGSCPWSRGIRWPDHAAPPPDLYTSDDEGDALPGGQHIVPLGVRWRCIRTP